VVSNGDWSAAKEGFAEDCGAHAGVVVVGGAGGVGNTNTGRFDGEGEEGMEIRGDGGWIGATE